MNATAFEHLSARLHGWHRKPTERPIDKPIAHLAENAASLHATRPCQRHALLLEPRSAFGRAGEGGDRATRGRRRRGPIGPRGTSDRPQGRGIDGGRGANARAARPRDRALGRDGGTGGRFVFGTGMWSNPKKRFDVKRVTSKSELR